jgi:hypothetical protein
MENNKKPTFENFVVVHIILIVMIVGSFALWLIVNQFWPEFFNPFQYWSLADNALIALVQSWPFYLYALIGAFIGLKDIEKIYDKDVIFAQDIYTSIMAGILEEIGYRCLFIFTAMIPIALSNLIIPGAIIWIYRNLTFPIVDVITLGLMHETIYGFPVLFMTGAISANAAFRDGHKYQGVFGWINAWFAGLYLLCVMLTRGLIIAILVHMIYDLIFAVTRYVGRHWRSKRRIHQRDRFSSPFFEPAIKL